MRLSPRRRALLLWLLLLTILTPFALKFLVRQMLYPAPAFPVPPAPAPLEEEILETVEGDRVVAWVSELPKGPAVLFLHGNGENLETLRLSRLFESFGVLGMSVVAVDYPGYGRSDGKPSEKSLVAAGLAGFDALERRFPDRPLFVVGWSLGAAVAVQTAAQRQEKLTGQVFLSPWHDLPTLAERHFPKLLVRLALGDSYHSGDAAGGLTRPTLVVHGQGDDLIPASDGRRLSKRLPEGSRYVELQGVGHNGLMGQPALWREIAAYVESTIAAPAP